MKVTPLSLKGLVWLGLSCLLVSNGEAQVSRAPRSQPAQATPLPVSRGVLSEFVSGAYRVVGPSVRRNVAFVQWELPNRVYSITTITRNQRVLEIGRVNDDGSVEESSNIGFMRGRIEEDGSLVLHGQQSGRSVSTEFSSLGGGRFAIRFNIEGRIVDYDVEPISQDEARRLAARLYPAEYGQHAAPREERRSPPQAIPRPSRVRYALVVGIGNYSSLPDLRNPANDARAVAQRLTALGFQVELLIDPERARLEEAVARITTSIEAGTQGSSALFYYAGHAVEIRGRNFLLPAEMSSRPVNIETEAIPVDSVLAAMAVNRRATRVVILDACRDSPVRRGEFGRGLALLSAPEGTFIAYSTAPGMVAVDGTGRNSPFAEALIGELGQSRRPIEEVFRGVRRAVLRTTNGAQTPWDSSSLLEPYSFHN